MTYDEDVASEHSLKKFSSILELCIECRQVCAWNNHAMSTWRGRHIKESTCIKCSASVKVNTEKLSMYGSALHGICREKDVNVRVKRDKRKR